MYGTRYNQFPLGDLFARNITLKMGQAPVYQMIKDEKFDPTDIITHRFPLTQAEHAYSIFDEKEDSCIKVVLKP